jgi:hypothetical protein
MGKHLLIPQKFPVDVYKGGHVAPVYTFIDGVGNQSELLIQSVSEKSS